MPKKPKTPKKPKIITQEQFARWSPEHQQRALNDRRVRQRIETKALPKEWQDKRAEAIRNRTPITEGSSTTYGDLAKQRAYMEKLTFGEGDRQLADRYQNLADARRRDSDWFSQYRQAVSQAQDKSIQAQKDAVSGNQAFIDSANQVAASSRDAVAQQLRDRAAQLGQTDQSAEYRGLADAAAAARASAMTNTAQRQVADAASGVNMATAGVTTAALKDLEAQGYRNRQSDALQKDTRDYVDKRASWREKFISDAIAEARKQVLEDRAFQVNAADKAADNARADAAFQNTVRSGRASRRIQRDSLRERERAARERERMARERAAKQGSGGTGRKDQRTGAQNLGVKADISDAVEWARWSMSSNGGGKSQGAVRQALLAGGQKTTRGKIPKFSKDVVNTAMDLAVLGYMSKPNRRVWQRAGYDVRSWGFPLRKPSGYGGVGTTGSGQAR